MLGDGMCILPQPFPWRTIIGQCWLGGHKNCLLWKNQSTRENYANNLKNRYIWKGICAILASTG
jgi:hypothetical protein